MFEWTETGSPRLQIMGHSNKVMSCDDISIGFRSHLFPNLRLAAYVHGNTMLSEYCICDRSKNTTK